MTTRDEEVAIERATRSEGLAKAMQVHAEHKEDLATPDATSFLKMAGQFADFIKDGTLPPEALV